MECAVMKQLCLVAIVLWLSASAAVGTQHSPLTLHNKETYAAMGCSDKTAVCQDGFELLPSQQCYFFSCKTATWSDALETCRSMGATLAYPVNTVEDTILANYLIFNFGAIIDWWLGASDTAAEGKWVWAHDNSPLAYTNWAPGEPNNNYGDEDCLQYQKATDWEWNDEACSSYRPFVCQQL